MCRASMINTRKSAIYLYSPSFTSCLGIQGRRRASIAPITSDSLSSVDYQGSKLDPHYIDVDARINCCASSVHSRHYHLTLHSKSAYCFLISGAMSTYPPPIQPNVVGTLTPSKSMGHPVVYGHGLSRRRGELSDTWHSSCPLVLIQIRA